MTDVVWNATFELHSAASEPVVVSLFLVFLSWMSIMHSADTESPAKKPYVAPTLTMHGDLRTLTQAGSVGSGETGNCKGGGNPTCQFKT